MAAGTHLLPIVVANLPSGVYVAQVTAGSAEVRSKIVVAR